MDGEAGTTVADRSTAAVGVANEDGEAPPAVRQDGATADGTTTDDQTSSTPDGSATRIAPEERQTPIAEPAQKSSQPVSTTDLTAVPATGGTALPLAGIPGTPP